MSNRTNLNAANEPGPEKVEAPPRKSADDLAREAAAAEAAEEATQPQNAPDAPEPPDEPERPAQRRPLGRREAKLAYPPRNGFVRRWINDWPGRIGNAQAGGYAHVNEGGKPVTRVVGTNEAGGPLHAYLMEIPQKFYDEDAEAKRQHVDEVDAQIYGGTFKADPSDLRYVPPGSIAERVRLGRGA